MKMVGIAGVGGIGSNVAMILVRTGYVNFKIVDFDIIEESNLNRQFYFHNQIGRDKIEMLEKNLKEIDNNVVLEKEKKLLNKINIMSTFSKCDIIIEGFDKIEDKMMLIETFSNTNKVIVSACGVAGIDIEEIITKKLQNNIYIVGDFKSDIKDQKIYFSKIIIIASIMANITLKKLGFKDNL